jgi:hypothetical protein
MEIGGYMTTPRFVTKLFTYGGVPYFGIRDLKAGRWIFDTYISSEHDLAVERAKELNTHYGEYDDVRGVDYAASNAERDWVQ